MYCFIGNNAVNFIDPYGLFLEDPKYDRFFQNVSDFCAGTGDALSFGLTSLAREAMGTNSVVHTDSGAYIAGEVTEFTVEIAVTGGGAALRHVAKNSSRAALEGTARRSFRRAFKLVGKGGEIHHWNPIKGHPGGLGSYYPLPFKWAARGFWNLTHVATKAQHLKIHEYLKALEAIHKWRERTNGLRQIFNHLLQSHGDQLAASINSAGVSAQLMGECPPPVFITIDLDIEMEWGLYLNLDALPESEPLD